MRASRAAAWQTINKGTNIGASHCYIGKCIIGDIVGSCCGRSRVIDGDKIYSRGCGTIGELGCGKISGNGNNRSCITTGY